MITLGIPFWVVCRMIMVNKSSSSTATTLTELLIAAIIISLPQIIDICLHKLGRRTPNWLQDFIDG